MGDMLFLAHRVPFPPNRGDKIRAHHLLRKLATIGRVHVGCFAESDEDRASRADLKRIAASHCVVNRSKPLVLAGAEAVLAGKPVSLTAFHSKKLQDWVRDTIVENHIETIVVFSGQMGQFVPDDFAGRVIIDLCDVDSAKFQSYAENGERVWLNAREARLLAVEEERLARRADATVLITENEAELFKSRLQFPSMARVEVIENGIDADLFDPANVVPHGEITARPGPHFVFTGQMDYRPNEQAALWVIEHFLPAIRERFAEAEFHIVGRNPTAALKATSDVPGVTVWGEVPDVKPFIAAADCVLATLLIARGVQNKVLEAMAMERVVLATPEAATGILARDSEHWLIEPAEAAVMVERIAPLLEDDAAKQNLGKAARTFVLEHHAWDAMLSPLEKLLEQSAQEARNAT